MNPDRKTPRRGRRAFAAGAACAAALLLSAAACLAQEAEERPRIFLEKKVYSSATETGKRVFYETRTVGEGDTLWKILTARGALSPDQFAAQLKEFRRINPSVRNLDRLVPGQQLQVPLPPPGGESKVREGRAVAHPIAKGESLMRILRARGVAEKALPKYLGAVKTLNPSVRNLDRILAGKTIYLPTESYFAPADAPAPAEPAAQVAAADVPAPKLVASPAPEEPSVPGAASPEATKPESAPPPAASLTREAPAESEEHELAAGKPGAELAPPPQSAADEPPPSTVTAAPPPDAAEAPAPERPPYRGMLADIVSALGEKWIDRGTLYLPDSGGGEVVINLADYPVVRFGTGNHAIIDFRGTLPPDVRTLVSGTWKEYRVVPFDDAPGPVDRIDRLLSASGYASVKEGIARPLVIGETAAVSLPARWQLFRTRQALDAGDVTLLKEVPEKLPADLDAVLTYAGRLGIRVLPVAWDTSTREGFLAGLAERKRLDAPEARRQLSGGLPALDSALSLLGIPSETDPTLKMSGKNDAFRLVIRPERAFSLDGEKYVVDSGRMSPAIRSIVKGAGYRLFDVGRGESGKMVFLRLLKAAGHRYEERRRFRIAGGAEEGFEVHVTGTFVTSKALLDALGVRMLVVVDERPGKERLHSATRALLRELGVGVIEWVD